MAITVYTKPGCVQCDMTKRKLDELDLYYEEIDLEDNQEELETLKQLGFLSAPVVLVDDGGVYKPEILESWAGYQPENLSALRQ